jgi:hypothetical protein
MRDVAPIKKKKKEGKKISSTIAIDEGRLVSRKLTNK